MNPWFIQAHSAPAAPAANASRQPTRPTFTGGLKVDSFLARLNGQPGSMTRKVGLDRRPAPPQADSSNWKSKWGLHDVRASTYVYQPKV